MPSAVFNCVRSGVNKIESLFVISRDFVAKLF